MEPRITVFIPVRNGEAFLGDAIESVLRQTFTNWRLVVRDNCSTDGTRDLVARYSSSDPRIRLVENDTNVGMVPNFNRCLESIDTEYYLLLCHDDFLWAPDALERGCAALDAHPNVSTVYGDLKYVNRDGLGIATRTYGRAGLVDSSVLARRSVSETRNLFGIPVLVRAAKLKDLRYDPSLPFAFDLDLSIAIAKGGPIYHIPLPLIANRYHGTNQTGVVLRGVVREMERIAEKRGIPLRRRDRVLMPVFGYCTTLGRQAFMFYARHARPRTETHG